MCASCHLPSPCNSCQLLISVRKCASDPGQGLFKCLPFKDTVQKHFYSLVDLTSKVLKTLKCSCVNVFSFYLPISLKKSIYLLLFSGHLLLQMHLSKSHWMQEDISILIKILFSWGHFKSLLISTSFIQKSHHLSKMFSRHFWETVSSLSSAPKSRQEGRLNHAIVERLRETVVIGQNLVVCVHQGVLQFLDLNTAQSRHIKNLFGLMFLSSHWFFLLLKKGPPVSVTEGWVCWTQSRWRSRNMGEWWGTLHIWRNYWGSLGTWSARWCSRHTWIDLSGSHDHRVRLKHGLEKMYHGV